MSLRSCFEAWLLVGAVATGSAFGCYPDQSPENFQFRAVTRKPGELSTTLVEALATSGLHPGETIGTVATYRADGLGQTVVQVMVDSPEPRAYVVDEEGNIYPTEVFWRMNQAAQHERYGKMTPELFSHYSQMGNDDSVTIEIQVAADVPEPLLPYDGTDVRVSLSEYEDWFNGHARTVEEHLAQTKAPLLAFITEHGGAIEHDLSSLPYVRATVSRELLQASFLNGTAVSSMALPSDDAGELLGGYAGAASMKIISLNGGACGSSPCSGAGLGVGLWEVDGGSLRSGIARNNLRIQHNSLYGYLNEPETCSTDADCTGNSTDVVRHCAAQPPFGDKICVQDHLSWVAASIGMYGSYGYTTTFPTGNPDPEVNVPFGTSFASTGAWDTSYKVGNDGTLVGLNYLTSTTDGAVAYVNRSAAPTNQGMNWPARAYGTFVTVAAGNSETGPVANYNLRNGLVVGMYSYNTYNSQTTHRRTSIAGGLGSSYVNNSTDPTLERPHLLAPGQHSNVSSGLHMPRINAPQSSSQMVHQLPETMAPIVGTSFAAPAALASALLTHEYEGLLSPVAYPMVNKAIQLASTRDANADGAIGKATTWSQSNDAEDGAGGIDATMIKQVLDNNRYVHLDLTDSSFSSCGTNCRQVQVGTIYAPANYTVRAALAWHSCLLVQDGLMTMNNDLDLSIQGSTALGNPCYGYKHSSAITSEVEMVSRSCSANITYKILVRIKNGASLQSCGTTTTERIGVAWALLDSAGGV